MVLSPIYNPLDIMLERVSVLSRVGGSITMSSAYKTSLEPGERGRDEIEFMKQIKSRGPRIEP